MQSYNITPTTFETIKQNSFSAYPNKFFNHLGIDSKTPVTISLIQQPTTNNQQTHYTLLIAESSKDVEQIQNNCYSIYRDNLSRITSKLSDTITSSSKINIISKQSINTLFTEINQLLNLPIFEGVSPFLNPKIKYLKERLNKGDSLTEIYNELLKIKQSLS